MKTNPSRRVILSVLLIAILTVFKVIFLEKLFDVLVLAGSSGSWERVSVV